MKDNLLKWIRRNGIVIFLLLVISLYGFPLQMLADDTVDSLKNLVFKSENDTNKANLLIQLSDAYSATEYDQALTISKSCLALSEELDFNRGKLFASVKLGKIFKNIGEFDSAIIYTEQAIQYAEILGDEKQQVKNYNIYGSLLRRKGYNSSALDFHNKGLSLSSQIGDSLGIANSCIYIAIIYDMTMKYDSAISYYYKSMRIYEDLGNKRNIGVTLLNIGDMYASLLDYKIAKGNYENGLSLFKEQQDLRYIGLSNNKIGILYSETGNYDSALYHFQLSKLYYDSIENKPGIAHLHINMGNLFLNWEKYDSAQYYFTKSENTFKQMDFKRGYLNALLGLARLYLTKGQNLISLKIYDTCQIIASQVSPQLLLDVYDNILSIYKNSGNYQKAFEYQTKYLEINDSIFQLEKAKTIADIELKYEKEKDQARILALENENLAKDLSLRKRTNQRNIYLFSGIGIIAVIMFLFVFYRLKARKDSIIAKQKIKQLEEEKKLLAAKSLVEGQEEERKRIAKELHDGLGVLLSTTKIQFTSIKDKSPENKEIIDKATKMLEQATGDVRKISHNMMPGLLTRFGLFEAAEDLIEQLDETEGLTATCFISGNTERLPENKEIMLYRILQELVNNTIKHANASTISLKIDIQPEALKINYTDNGKGFDLKEQLNIKSIGLSSIHSRVGFLGGNVVMDSKPGEGINCIIQVPNG